MKLFTIVLECLTRDRAKLIPTQLGHVHERVREIHFHLAYCLNGGR